MYPWLVFLHVIAVFAFLMAHGVSISVAFALRRERNPDRIQTLLNLSGSAIGILNGAIGIILLSGIVSGFMGQWWDRGWIWLSLGLLIATAVFMFAAGTGYYGRVRTAVAAYLESQKLQSPSGLVSTAEIDKLLSQSRPLLLAVVGFGSLAVITWLMKFKPF